MLKQGVSGETSADHDPITGREAMQIVRTWCDKIRHCDPGKRIDHLHSLIGIMSRFVDRLAPVG